MADNKEPNKVENNQPNRSATPNGPTGGITTASGSSTTANQSGNTGAARPVSSGSGGAAARPAAQPNTGQSVGERYEEVRDNVTEWGTEAIGQAQEKFRNAYDQASQSVSDKWQQAQSYGRENPGQTTLIAFAAGVGIGLLLASGSRSHSRSRRLLPPIMNALTEIADEFFG